MTGSGFGQLAESEEPFPIAPYLIDRNQFVSQLNVSVDSDCIYLTISSVWSNCSKDIEIVILSISLVPDGAVSKKRCNVLLLTCQIWYESV